MIVFCYPSCSTCKKAIAYLEGKGMQYTCRNIKEAPPTKAELGVYIERSGIEAKRFFNTSGLSYRSLNIRVTLPSMDTDQIIDLLAADGMLVKRPLVVFEKGVLVGFKQAEWDAFFRS